MSMNDADLRISAWLDSVAPAREPEHLLDTVLAQTARTRRRPAWRIPEMWIRMTTLTTPVTTGGGRWPLAVATALLVLALVGGALLVAGLRNTTVPAPFGPASNGLLVHDIHGELVSVDLDTGASTVILEAVGQQVAPRFSHDGTQVAFLAVLDPSATRPPAEFELRVAGLDGSAVRSLGTFSEPGGEWSPSGEVIVHESLVDGESAITIVDVASGRSRVLDLGMPAQQPAFRPSDPNQLVFRGQAPDGTWGLYLGRLDGGAPTHLDLDPGFELDAHYPINTDRYFFAPVWSPDGRRLAYYTLEESTVDPDPGFRVRVAEIDANGAVTAEALLAPDAAIDDESEPAWLPDGSGVVVHRVEEGRDAVVRWPIGQRLDEAPQPVVLADDLFDVRFVIAPDGSEVLVWRAWSPASRVPMDGGPATQTDIVLGNVATWQRTAP